MPLESFYSYRDPPCDPKVDSNSVDQLERIPYQCSTAFRVAPKIKTNKLITHQTGIFLILFHFFIKIQFEFFKKTKFEAPQ